MGFSVGIIIHNEERNVGRLLASIEESFRADPQLDSVVVVSSAGTDRSDEIVRTASLRWPIVRLITEPERRGKASAINLFLAAVRSSKLCVLLSGDVLPQPGALSKLLDAFADPAVGMVAGRPVPVAGTPGVAGRIARMQWDLHHEVSLHAPKLGEAVAFRNVVEQLPSDTAVDEAALESILTGQGFRLAYAGDAIIFNKGPETIGDFLKQRRRIAAGHFHLRATRKYAVSTTKSGLVLPATWRLLRREPSRLGTAVTTASLEVVGRFLGWWDYRVRGKNPFVWEIAKSTKDLGDGAR